jgi:GH35 family endo-1,4-beta-xylanase
VERRTFLQRLGTAAAMAPPSLIKTSLGTHSALQAVTNAVPKGARQLKLRLDGPADDAAFCGGPGRVYVTDLRHRSRFVELDWTGDGVLSVEVPPQIPLAVSIYLALPEYGRVWVTLDNEGHGYPGDSTLPLSVMEEAVKSQLAKCRRRLAESQLPKPPTEELERAEEEWKARNLTVALRHALRAGEDIEEGYAHGFFKGGDSSTALISGTLFGERRGEWAIGVGPDWPFGVPPPDFLRPRNCWMVIADLCNATTLPSFWRWIEPVRGHFNWRSLEAILDFAESRHMKAKSFALYWGGVGGTPPWFRQLKFSEQKAAIERWAQTLVKRYRGRIAAWETVNEMHDWPFANQGLWSHEQILEVSRMVNELVGALDPGTPRVINNCCIWGEYVQGFISSGMSGRSGRGVWCPLSFLEEAIHEGIPFESIGLQYYNPGRDLMECASHLDRFRALGKQVWITEMGTPSSPRKKKGEGATEEDPLDGWRGPWSLERQAEWCELWYTFALARKEVRALNWWDFDDRQAFVASGGLLDSNCDPKPSYQRLIGLCRRLKVGAPA